MENKLGLSQDRMEDIENKLYELKSSLLDLDVSFNTNGFDIIYLMRLHEFLFGDLYYNAGKLSSRYEEDDKYLFDNVIQEAIDLIKAEEDPEAISSVVNELIDYQIFDDGNSRTIHLFFDHIIDCYEMHNVEYASKLKEEIKKHGRKY